MYKVAEDDCGLLYTGTNNILFIDHDFKGPHIKKIMYYTMTINNKISPQTVPNVLY